MSEIEPKQTFTGRTWEIHLWDDEEEVTVTSKRNKAWITGMVGPIYKSEYPKLFNDNPSRRGIDQSARQLIKEMIGRGGDSGFEECWSDGFPIERFFPFREMQAQTLFLAEVLRYFLEPSGPDKTLQPGDITKGVEKCLNRLVDPNIQVDFKLRIPNNLGRLGVLWEKGDKHYEVEVMDIEDERLFSEGHEAGHLMRMYFLEEK